MVLSGSPSLEVLQPVLLGTQRLLHFIRSSVYNLFALRTLKFLLFILMYFLEPQLFTYELMFVIKDDTVF